MEEENANEKAVLYEEARRFEKQATVFAEQLSEFLSRAQDVIEWDHSHESFIGELRISGTISRDLAGRLAKVRIVGDIDNAACARARIIALSDAVEDFDDTPPRHA